MGAFSSSSIYFIIYLESTKIIRAKVLLELRVSTNHNQCQRKDGNNRFRAESLLSNSDNQMTAEEC
jgi:hypothetical protein